MSAIKKLSAATDHPSFTDVTWATKSNIWDTPAGHASPPLWQVGLSTNVARGAGSPITGWAAEHDLAKQLAAKNDMPFEWCRELVSAACSGLPITLRYKQQHLHTIATETVIISQLHMSSLAMRTWGSAHPVRLDQLTNVSVPESSYEIVKD